MVMDTMNPYVIEHLCMIRDDDNDNYSDIEDHGDADGDGDCFRRIDCPGDGYDDVADDFDDEHGDFFWYLARDLVIIFANVLHLYIHCIVADVARLLQSCNGCLMVIATLRCDDVAGDVFGDGDGYGDCYGVWACDVSIFAWMRCRC